MKSAITNNKLAIGLIAFVLFLVAQAVLADVTIDHSVGVERFQHNSLFSATTTQATSTPISIAGAERVEIYFKRLGASNSVATSTFNVQVSPNGTDWYDYNKLVSNVTNTNGQMPTRVASVTIVGATSTTIVAMDLQFDAFRQMRCVATQASTTLESTDGSTCEASVKGKL